MRKIAFLSLLLIFSGCFGGDSDSTAENLVSLSQNYYEIDYPASWEIFDSKDLANKTPSGTLLIIRSNVAHKGAFPNISIVEEKVSEGMSSIEFAKVNIEKAPLIIHNLQTVSKNELEINGEKTILFNFIGRIDDEEDDLQFYQIYYTKAGKGVSVTASCTTDADEAIKTALQNSIKSFKFKKQVNN